jgi:hypothetical protein
VSNKGRGIPAGSGRVFSQVRVRVGEFLPAENPYPSQRVAGFRHWIHSISDSTLFLPCHVRVTTFPTLSARATTNATMQRRMGWKRRGKRELDRKENKITIAK